MRASSTTCWNFRATVTQGAILRDESRGAHYKPDFPERNDEKFLKTTKASFTGSVEGPRFEYEEVDTQYIKPRPRRYDAAKWHCVQQTFGRVRRTANRRSELSARVLSTAADNGIEGLVLCEILG